MKRIFTLIITLMALTACTALPTQVDRIEVEG